MYLSGICLCYGLWFILLCRNKVQQYLSDHLNDSLAASQVGKTQKIKGDTILLMLLRLRQCCSHPTLTKEVLHHNQHLYSCNFALSNLLYMLCLFETKVIVKEELEGEGVELGLVAALKELSVQETNIPKDMEQMKLPTSSCKVSNRFAYVCYSFFGSL